ncbi:TSUP family transporter [Duganella sp. FT92W]|uniref:Probable membrane transporter protein n=1 Tax=Pseudoduganella rivuli TaxID=2666085 RepID=A0A7X2IIV2_9BURK|nr:sulfite exporter TauE/SafE family protein [Pseudoduganella rivuli]MRV70357.1 TSUP family transporter [Pseudoduganella rivuli]
MPADLSYSEFAIVWCAVASAYVIFSIAGFGTALVASPILAQFVPVAHIVPLLALLDFFAAATNLARDGRHAEVAELKRLVPLMMAGSAVGAAVLLYTRPDILMLMLGIFVIAYALYSLSGLKPDTRFSAGAAIPFGLVGGMFSALFGSGGFLYSIYLTGRIDDKNRVRITQSTLIGMSTLTRLVFFVAAGVYANTGLLLLAAMLATAMLCGVFVGRRITLKLTREQFIRVVNVVVLVSGVFLLLRYFS